MSGPFIMKIWSEETTSGFEKVCKRKLLISPNPYFLISETRKILGSNWTNIHVGLWHIKEGIKWFDFPGSMWELLWVRWEGRIQVGRPQRQSSRKEAGAETFDLDLERVTTTGSGHITTAETGSFFWPILSWKCAGNDWWPHLASRLPLERWFLSRFTLKPLGGAPEF